MAQPVVTSTYRWHSYANAQSMAHAAAGWIQKSADAAVAARGRFLVVLAGGQTPQATHRLLKLAAADWRFWHIYFGDERCLPANNKARNSRMARDAWLDHVPIPENQVHAIAAELGPDEGARTYREMLAAIDEFDLVVLGLGDDGHTASLFPGHDWGVGADSPPALAVFDSPKPPPERVSLSAWRLGYTRELLFLVAGQSKREAVTAWRRGDPIPARAINPSAGIDVLVEALLLT